MADYFSTTKFNSFNTTLSACKVLGLAIEADGAATSVWSWERARAVAEKMQLENSLPKAQLDEISNSVNKAKDAVESLKAVAARYDRVESDIEVELQNMVSNDCSCVLIYAGGIAFLTISSI